MRLTIRPIIKIRVYFVCLKDGSSIIFLSLGFKAVKQDILISQGQTDKNFLIFTWYTGGVPSLYIQPTLAA